jgi:2-polyprenyl-3-methyl-5-hydroxy-6-metoxy-1,4-benzoquinol methylase
MPPLLSNWLRRQRQAALAPYLRGAVLDIGCGLGELARLLPPGQPYVGVDRRPDWVERLRREWPQHEFHVRDIEQQDLELERRFDTIVMAAVIEHLRRPERVLRQLPGCLEPGGRLLITTPSPLGNALHAAGARLGLVYLAAADEHVRIYTALSVQPLLARFGLQLAASRPFLLGGNQLFVCSAG